MRIEIKTEPQAFELVGLTDLYLKGIKRWVEVQFKDGMLFTLSERDGWQNVCIREGKQEQEVKLCVKDIGPYLIMLIRTESEIRPLTSIDCTDPERCPKRAAVAEPDKVTNIRTGPPTAADQKPILKVGLKRLEQPPAPTALPTAADSRPIRKMVSKIPEQPPAPLTAELPAVSPPRRRNWWRPRRRKSEGKQKIDANFGAEDTFCFQTKIIEQTQGVAQNVV